MAENTQQTKIIAWVVLTTLIVFLIYLTYAFVPAWTYHFEHIEGTATVEVVNKEDKSFIYSYFNEYQSQSVQNVRKIEKAGDFGLIREGSNISISYSKYMSGYVRFDSFDYIPPLSLTIGVYLLALIGIALYIGVLLNKVSLEMLAGVREKESSVME
jgi:hypothetical protein